MPAAMHVLGPGHLFVRFRAQVDPTANYVGTAEIAPVIEVESPKLEVKNDLTGRTYPFQKVEDGERHTYTIVLNRFDYVIWNAIRDTYDHTTNQNIHGRDGKNKRGSLYMGVGDFQLIHIHDFTYISPVHHDPDDSPFTLGEPRGRIYQSAELIAYKEDPSANRVQTIAATFRCDGIYTNDGDDRFIWTFSEDPADFGALPAVN